MGVEDEGRKTLSIPTLTFLLRSGWKKWKDLILDAKDKQATFYGEKKIPAEKKNELH